MAAAFSVPLLLATALLLLVQKKLLGRRGYAAGRRQGRAAPGDPARRVALPRAPRLPRRAGVRGLPARTASSPRPPSPAPGPSPSRGTTSRSATGRSRSSTAPPRTPSSTRSSWASSRRAWARGSRRCSPTSPTASSSSATSSSAFLALAPVVIPGVVLAVAALHRLHAAALPPLRHALDPLRRVPHQGDARRLLAVRRHVPRHPRGARGGRAHPRRRPAARARRDHRAARHERHHRRPGASSSSASSASCRPRSSSSRPTPR